MKTETAGKIKYGGWSLFIRAVIAMIIGFGCATRPYYYPSVSTDYWDIVFISQV